MKPRSTFARLTGKEFEKNLQEYTAALKLRIAAGVEGFKPGKAEQAKRRARVAKNYGYFADIYFPHYNTHTKSATHAWIHKNLPAQIDLKRGTATAFCAPRGEGKSTEVSLKFILWCVLTGRKTYPFLFSDTSEQAAMLLSAIKAELEVNPRLMMDFPDACGAGGIWRSNMIQTRNGAMIEARGSGQAVRGRRNVSQRPDLIVGDDLENDENVRSIDQRMKLKRWWNRAVNYLGPPDGSADKILVGTIIHYDSLLSKTIADGMYLSAKFRSIITWPDRMDMWEKFAEIIRDNPDGGVELAIRYYERQRKKMDAGAKVSWPAAQPLLKLMLERADSPGDFAAEKQNEPAAEDDAPFANSLHCWIKLPARLVYFGAVDPSLGRKSHSADPSAILIGAIEYPAPRRPALYVVVADIRKRRPDIIIRDVINYQQRFKVTAWAVESVAFQEYFRDELVTKGMLANVPIAAHEVVPHTDKGMRILTLQPHLKDERILLHKDQTTLGQQLLHYPFADHDDGPDCLHMLYEIAVTLGWRDPGKSIKSRPRADRVDLKMHKEYR